MKNFKISSNIFPVYKPRGITSFDVIRILRKKLGIKKIGHGGTLDPAAEGLLMIGVNDGTKELSGYLGMEKTYEADVLFGIATDTGDGDGKIVEKNNTQTISREDIEKVIKNLKGDIELSVPLYSAVKVKGKTLYKYARQGIKISPPKRKMKIYSIELKSSREVLGKEIKRFFLDKEEIDDRSFFYIATFIMEVGGGAYVRAISEEIGRRLGSCATTIRLVRKKIGNIGLDDAVEIKELKLEK